MIKYRGLSLITLIVTIIIIVILAGAVILSIANNNPVNNSNQAVFSQDLVNYKEQLANSIMGKALSTLSTDSAKKFRQVMVEQVKMILNIGYQISNQIMLVYLQ